MPAARHAVAAAGLFASLPGPAAADYDGREAEKFWGLAAATYCWAHPGFNTSLYVSWQCGHACDRVGLVPGSVKPFGQANPWLPNTAHGFVGKFVPAIDGRCVVAFKGSTGLKDALTNVASSSPAALDGCVGCRVGRGFKDTYDAVSGDIKAHLRHLGCQSVALTGHSLGAGQATLALFDLQRDFRMEASYTFGGPAIGNRAFRDALDAALASPAAAPLYRVVNGTDPVPHSGPLDAAEGMYVHHPGTEVFFRGRVADGYETCSSSNALSGCSYRFFKERTGLDVRTITTLADGVWRLGLVALLNLEYHTFYLDQKLPDAERNCIVQEQGAGAVLYP